jgi:hypothetical protein
MGWQAWNDPRGNSPRGGHCFLRGTLIQTLEGEIAVEEPTIGILVETLNGPLPIKWIGRQRFRKDSASWHWSVAPIRVARFALSDHYPRRDLYLSPRHSLLIDDFLIPAERLVSGRSIVQTDSDDSHVIDYFHISLETHQVVFAEGAPAETLLVTIGRKHFANFAEYERRYGAESGRTMKPFVQFSNIVAFVANWSACFDWPFRRSLTFVTQLDPIKRARARIAARAITVHAEVC